MNGMVGKTGIAGLAGALILAVVTISPAEPDSPESGHSTCPREAPEASSMIAVSCRTEIEPTGRRQEMRTDDNLPPCHRCGAQIEESDSDVLLVYSSTERHFEKTGDLGDLIEAYCETCTREIEEAHKGHDDQVEVMRRELESLPTHRHP